jgi:hypothetical protein
MMPVTKPVIDVQVVGPEAWADVREQVVNSYEHVPTIGPTGDYGTKIARADGRRGAVAVELVAGGPHAHVVDGLTGRPVSRETMSLNIVLSSNLRVARDAAPIILVSASYARAWMIRADEGEGPEAERLLAELCEQFFQELGRDTQLLIQSKLTTTYSVQGPGLDAVQTFEVLPDTDNVVVSER